MVRPAFALSPALLCVFAPLKGGLTQLGLGSALGDPLCLPLTGPAPPWERWEVWRPPCPLLPWTLTLWAFNRETSVLSGETGSSRPAALPARRPPWPGGAHGPPLVTHLLPPLQPAFGPAASRGMVPAGPGQTESEAPHAGASQAGEKLFSPPERIFQIFFSGIASSSQMSHYAVKKHNIS